MPAFLYLMNFFPIEPHEELAITIALLIENKVPVTTKLFKSATMGARPDKNIIFDASVPQDIENKFGSSGNFYFDTPRGVPHKNFFHTASQGFPQDYTISHSEKPQGTSGGPARFLIGEKHNPYNTAGGAAQIFNEENQKPQGVAGGPARFLVGEKLNI